MKYATLELLCCPTCQSTLRFSNEPESGIIDDGRLLCTQCERSYPIHNGTVNFIEPQELEGPNSHFARYYDRLAPFYSLFTKLAFLPFGGERKAREEILDRLNFNGGRTLEVSIGNGINLPYFFESPNIGEIYGLDISLGQLSGCKRLLNKKGWQVDLFLGVAEALPFKPNTFDNVLHIGGINFFSDKKQAIDEMIRVARPGSKIVIADEAERLAKRVNKSIDISSPGQGVGKIETTIINLVPKTMKEIRAEGIWKTHGKHHGYCLEFIKPT